MSGHVVFRDVEVRGSRVDVEVRAGVVRRVVPSGAVSGAGLGVPRSERSTVLEIDGHGGALLPALHDHHLHLAATAALTASVDVSHGWEALGTAAQDGRTGWIRAVGAAESVDRHLLDRWAPHRPVRVQHRSGALWMLNSAALAQVAGALDDSADVERDASGTPTGRLWRYDARLRAALPDRRDELRRDLADLVRRLRRLGVGSVTDATPDLDPAGVSLLGSLDLPVTALGDPDGTAPWKLHLRDHDLPGLDDLEARIEWAHRRNRGVAVHCVTRESLLLSLAALDSVGRHPEDRIEHASVVVDPEQLRGLTVVTQPGFLIVRGEDYRRGVHPDDLPGLYRWRSLARSGACVLPSSDAPHGPLDPWQVMLAARDRTTSSGEVLGAGERTTVRAALRGYLSTPTGTLRRVEPGTPGLLTLLGSPLRTVLAEPDAERVRGCLTGASPEAVSFD